MKRRGTWLMAVLCVLLAGSLFGCEASKKTNYKIDLIVKETHVDFWNSLHEGAQAAAAVYGATVTLYGPETEVDFSAQIDLLKESVARRPEAIVLAAADYELLSQPVSDAIDAGVPVVMIDSDVDNDRTVAFLGTDNRELGKKLAESLCQRLDRSGDVAILNFVRESYPALQRENGFRDQIRLDNRFRILKTEYCDSDIDTAQNQVTALVEQNPDLVAIAALNAKSATGAARALSALGRSDIQLFAVDCTPEEAMFMEEDVLDLALLQNPYQMGYDSVETTCRYLNGEKVDDIYTDIYLVDKSTMFDNLYQQLIFPFE